jgi:predicted PurR-regulated permease PerM
VSVHREIGRSLGAYVQAQLQNALITIGLFIVGFAVTGVPWWALTGFVCGVVNLVPHLGPVIALLLGLYVRWLTTDDWVKLAYVGAAWLAIQVIDGFVLSPRAAGRAGVNPFLSIVITLVAGMMFGPIGMILAVPIVAVILIVWRATRKRA